MLSAPQFWNAAFNTGVWLVVFSALVTAVALLVSIMIWFAARGPMAVAFRTVFILPMTISLAAVGVIWGFVYNPDPEFGVLNALVRALHLELSQAERERTPSAAARRPRRHRRPGAALVHAGVAGFVGGLVLQVLPGFVGGEDQDRRQQYSDEHEDGYAESHYRSNGTGYPARLGLVILKKLRVDWNERRRERGLAEQVL
jgi:hypothetical protein